MTRAQLYDIMIEQHGGQALSEILLDRAIDQRLRDEGLALDAEAIQTERQRLLDAMSDDPDQAARLLAEMRSQRGLGAQRFDALLRRNAGLRLLVAPEIQVNEPAVQQAYALAYGTRYRVRLITTDTVGPLSNARRSVTDGGSFTDLAIGLSTDASAAQGGLLSPISPADPTYPKAIRDALPTLKMDDIASRLSSVIALPDGYALLWLEEVIYPEQPPMETVRPQLEQSVRLQLERLRMQQLARALVERANLVILDPALEASWKRQRDEILRP